MPTLLTPPRHYLNDGYGIRSWLLTRDHKRIALLYLADENAFAEHLLQLRERQPFAFEGGFECSFGFDLVVFADRLEHLGELGVAHDQAHLFGALHQQHFIDNGHDSLWRDLREELGNLGIGHPARIACVGQFSNRGELNSMELGLRDDFAVHLNQYLLENFRRDGTSEDQRTHRRK